MPVHSGIRCWFLPVALVNKVVDRVANVVNFFFTEVSWDGVTCELCFYRAGMVNWWRWCQVHLCLRFWLSSMIIAFVYIDIWIIITWPSNIHMCFFVPLWIPKSVGNNRERWMKYVLAFSFWYHYLLIVFCYIHKMWFMKLHSKWNECQKIVPPSEQHSSQNFETFNECVTAEFSLKSTRAVLEQWWCLTPLIIGKYNLRYKFGTREQKGLPFLP